ncbi:hypothetical protein V5E38_07805 [Rossellomorea sp. GAMAL-10_SWC]
MKLAINTIGLIGTSVVTIIFAITKFVDGAWVVLVVILAIILFSLAIYKHYQNVAEELRIGLDTFKPKVNKVITIILVSGTHRVVHNTLSFAKGISNDLLAVYVGFDDEATNKMEEKWGNPCRLVVLKSQYRSVLEPLSRFIKLVEAKEENSQIQIVIPQFIPTKWWHNIITQLNSIIASFMANQK